MELKFKSVLFSFVLLSFSIPFLNAQTNYYVATNGSNSNTGTSISDPWLTIQHALWNVPAGAILNVRAGVYNEKIYWPSSGISGLPTTLKSYEGETATLSGNGITSLEAMITISSKSFIEIKNLILEDNYMAGAKGIHLLGEGENVTIEGCIIRNIGFTNDPTVDPTSITPWGQAHGILVNGRTTLGYKDITIKDNELYNLICGNSEALTFVGNNYDFKIDNNVLHNNTNIGIDIAGHFTWAIDGGVDPTLNQSRDGTVTRNIVYDHRRFNNVDAPPGIYTDGGKDILIEHNYSFRNGNGMSVGCENSGKSAENIIVRNNFIFDNDNNGIFFGANTGNIINCELRNNTFFKNGKIVNFTMEVFLQKSTDCLIANNLFYAKSISHYGIGLFSYTVTNLTIDENLVFREGGDFSNLITGSPTVPVNTNTTVADPLLVDTNLPSPDLHIQTNSPAINEGNSSYLTPNEEEIDAGIRAVGIAVDLGADEYGSTGCRSTLLFNAIIPSSPYQAADEIISKGLVELSAVVDFTAPSVLLTPGFEVELGGIFTVETTDCVITP